MASPSFVMKGKIRPGERKEEIGARMGNGGEEDENKRWGEILIGEGYSTYFNARSILSRTRSSSKHLCSTLTQSCIMLFKLDSNCSIQQKNLQAQTWRNIRVASSQL